MVPHGYSYAKELIDSAIYDSFEDSQDRREAKNQGEIFAALPLADKDTLLTVLDENIASREKSLAVYHQDSEKAWLVSLCQKSLERHKIVQDALLKLRQKDL